MNKKVVLMLFVLVMVAAVHVAGRLYSQFKPVQVVTASEEPFPEQLRLTLVRPSGVSPPTTFRKLTAYDLAHGKLITSFDMRQIRRTLAWTGPLGAYWPERIEINSGSNVVAFVPEAGRRFLLVEMAKASNTWSIVGVTAGLGEGERPSLGEIVLYYARRVILGRR